MSLNRGKKAYANTCPAPTAVNSRPNPPLSMPMLTEQTKAPRSDVQTHTSESGYVLVTAAYNEEENIGKTIESVLSQSRLPNRWVIVSDGSVDRTDEIVQGFAQNNDFIRFLRVKRRPGRSFGAKVRALHAGNELLRDVSCAFIGNLDADVSIGPSYFEDLHRSI